MTHVHTEIQELGWKEVYLLADAIAQRWGAVGVQSVWGVPRGGCVPAALVGERLGVRITDEITPATLIVDDLVDSGSTMTRYCGQGLGFDALLTKQYSPTGCLIGRPRSYDGWVRFPWETVEESGPEDAVIRLLEWIGEDPTRDGLINTPGRVARAMREMTAGYAEDPAKILATMFDEHSDEMVLVRGVEFTSLCEHHMLPFTGTACVGYIPSQRVVGLSKLARLVDCFARRLQVQERMTTQIAEAVMEHLNAVGVGVIITARHSCMGCRGVRKPTAEMVTSAMLGALRDNHAARAEFMALTTM